MIFIVENEYIDLILGRRVVVGEVLELSSERVNTIQALGVRLTPVREKPPDTATAAPKGEKAVSNRGNKRT